MTSELSAVRSARSRLTSLFATRERPLADADDCSLALSELTTVEDQIRSCLAELGMGAPPH
jgi:hypothetical protein